MNRPKFSGGELVCYAALLRALVTASKYASALAGGMLPIPKRLVRQGVRDMLRISDARMSGTSYGACILHIAPEAYVGGPLALLRTGDLIQVDVLARSLNVILPDEVLAERRSNWIKPPDRYRRGFGWLSARHILQADAGCDFEVLTTDFGPAAGEPDIY